MIETAKKTKIMKAAGKHDADVGSTEVQISVLTARINELTDHLKVHKKDEHTRRGLLQMVGTRKRFLAYLKKTNFDSYAKLVKELNLRG